MLKLDQRILCLVVVCALLCAGCGERDRPAPAEPTRAASTHTLPSSSVTSAPPAAASGTKRNVFTNAVPDSVLGVRQWRADVLAALGDRPRHPARRVFYDNARLHLRKMDFLLRVGRYRVGLLPSLQEEARAVKAFALALQAEPPSARPPFVTRPAAGLQEEGFYAPNDDSYQPFVRYLPASLLAGGRPMPLLVYLHGYSPFLNLLNWSELPGQLIELAEIEGWAVVAPFARGNTDFQNVGEQDTLRAIQAMIRRYRIDADRIVLAGYSMGGMGAWTIGAHYPHLFAGMLIVSGRGDYYVWHDLEKDNVAAYKRRLIDAEFAGGMLANLRHLPVFCVHGGADSLIPVREARHIVSRARAAGVPVRYTEIPGADHWIFETAVGREDVRKWIGVLRRSVPAEISYRACDARFNRAYWLAWSDPLPAAFPLRVGARPATNAFAVDSHGVGALHADRRHMPAALRKLPLRALQGPAPREQTFGDALERALNPPSRGPIKNAFLAPFVFVDADETTAADMSPRLQRAASHWYEYAQTQPRTVREPDITADMLSAHNVFLFGEPESSALIRRVLRAAPPIDISAAHFHVGPQALPRKDHGLYFVYPSPWNTNRLAVVQCGTPWGEALPRNHRYDMLPDYIVYGQDTDDKDKSNTARAAGFFDRQWRITR